MTSMTIGLGLGQGQALQPAPGAQDLRQFGGIASDPLLPLQAGQGSLGVQITGSGAFNGIYQIQSDDLSSGPVEVLAPQIMQAPGAGPITVTPGLWAYDEQGSAPARSYRWQRDGVDIPGVTGPSYTPTTEDYGAAFQVIETVTGAGSAQSATSNAIVAEDLTDPFAVTLQSGGLVAITGNDGRDFTIETGAPEYHGTYTIAAGSLATGPVALIATGLIGDGTPAPGEVLNIRPALFAYDPQFGPVSVSYATNATNAVDGSDGAAPTLLVDTADADTTVHVTATATQGAASTDSQSAGLDISALPDPFAIALQTAGLLAITANDGRSFTLDDPSDRYDGNYSAGVAALSAGPVVLVGTALTVQNTAEAGQILGITPALFAFDPEQGAVSVSYTTNGTSTVDASDPANPVVQIDAADAGGTITVTATATQGSASVDSVSSSVEIADLPDPFAVSLQTGGLVEITGNDGRDFTIDAIESDYDGTYAIPAGGLASGPVVLVDIELIATGALAPGEVLNIRPALFAFDPQFGPVSVNYATNATNAVDDTDPTAPTLLIDVGDVAAALTVTATVTQGASSRDSVSDSVLIAPPVPTAHLAKSVIFDIANSHGGTSIGVRQIDFYLEGVRVDLPNPGSDYAASATSESQAAIGAFDTNASLTGGHGGGKSWLGVQNNGPQRLFVNFSTPVQFDEIRVNNYHNNGSATNRGIRDVTITISPVDTIDTAYQGAIEAPTVLGDFTFDQHADENQPDEFLAYSIFGLFSVELQVDDTVQIKGNDGRPFSIDDTLDRHDGTYSVPPGSLASGPVTLKPPVLSDDGTPEVGESLSIVPALFAYDPDLGSVTRSYSTNSANAVNTSDPNNPSLVISAADADTDITVTSLLTQASVTTASVSNAVSIPVPAIDVTATVLSQSLSAPIENNPSRVIDLSSYAAGTRLIIMVGAATNAAPTSVTVGGQFATFIASNNTNVFSGGRNHAFEYVLPAQGSAGTNVIANLVANTQNNWITIVAVENASVRDGFAQTTTNNSQPVSGTVTPSSPDNLILALVTTQSGYMGGHSWANATEAGFVENVHQGAVAVTKDAPLTALTVTLNPTSGASAALDAGLFVFSFSA